MDRRIFDKLIAPPPKPYVEGPFRKILNEIEEEKKLKRRAKQYASGKILKRRKPPTPETPQETISRLKKEKDNVVTEIYLARRFMEYDRRYFLSPEIVETVKPSETMIVRLVGKEDLYPIGRS